MDEEGEDLGEDGDEISDNSDENEWFCGIP